MKNFKPIRTKYSNVRFVLEGAGDLPAAKITFKDGGSGLASTWMCENLIERIKFLFSGKITLLIVSDGHPPTSIYQGELRVDHG